MCWQTFNQFYTLLHASAVLTDRFSIVISVLKIVTHLTTMLPFGPL